MDYTLFLFLNNDRCYNFSIYKGRGTRSWHNYLFIHMTVDSVEVEAIIDCIFDINIDIAGKCTLNYTDEDCDIIDDSTKLQQMINHYVMQITGNASDCIFSSLEMIEKLMIELYERLILITKTDPLSQEILDELCSIPCTKSSKLVPNFYA